MTTLKKIIGLVLVVTIFASTLMVLSSCKKDDKTHTHTFYPAWMTDAENHWHAASCGHTDQKGDLGNHKDKNFDDKCDICGYNMNSAGTNAPNIVTYTVYVKDASGNAVNDVKVWLVGPNSYTTYKISDSKGRISFTLEDGDWKAALAEIPEGCTITLDDRFTFDENQQVTIVIE